MLVQKHVEVLAVRMPRKVQAKPVQMTVESAPGAALRAASAHAAPLQGTRKVQKMRESRLLRCWPGAAARRGMRLHTLGTTRYARLSQRVSTATGTSRLTS